jgi:elongation factor G
MPSYTTADIRNVALVGHQLAGKTTLFEALLHAGGTIQTAGSVERGTTVSDFDPMEKARQHSISASIASIDHNGVHVNLIDTPGYPDFRGPTMSALAAVETCAIVVNAQNGVEFSTVRMMEYAKARRLCRFLVVNRIDGGNPRRVIEQLREAFGPECLRSTCRRRIRSRSSTASSNPTARPISGPSRTGTRRSSTRSSRSTKK